MKDFVPADGMEPVCGLEGHRAGLHNGARAPCKGINTRKKATVGALA